MRATVVDLGSNTFHVLVAEVDEYGIRDVILDEKIAVRLGERAFAEGAIPADAYARGLAAVDQLGALLDGHLRGSCRILATSVFRSAANGRDFIAEASERLGVAIDVVDGGSEAQLTWTGVSTELAGSHGRLAVLDLGGGSLECVWGDGRIDGCHSLPLGVLRLRHLGGEPLRDVIADVAGASLDALLHYDPQTIVLSSGTARALLRLARRMSLVAGEQRHLWRRTITELARTIPSLSPAELAGLGVDAARLDTIATGAITFDAMLEPLARPVVYIARSATREGALIELARRATRGVGFRLG